MGQQTLDGVDLAALREAYLERTTEQLPERARASEKWPIDQDHCFARVVLDNVFEDEWDDHVDGRPAYEQLSPEQLRRANGSHHDGGDTMCLDTIEITDTAAGKTDRYLIQSCVIIFGTTPKSGGNSP